MKINIYFKSTNFLPNYFGLICCTFMKLAIFEGNLLNYNYKF